MIWRLLRLNLWVADALQLNPTSGCDGAAALQETLFATFLAHMGAALFHTIVPCRKRPFLHRLSRQRKRRISAVADATLETRFLHRQIHAVRFTRRLQT